MFSNYLNQNFQNLRIFRILGSSAGLGVRGADEVCVLLSYIAALAPIRYLAWKTIKWDHPSSILKI